MQEYKREFIRFLLANGLGIFENPNDDRSLKSKRLSPWFLNIGDFNDGVTLSALADAYAQAIINSGVQLDTLYGIPEKGVGLVGPVAAKMGERGHNVGWFFTRKVPKEYGEATGKMDLTKLVVGRIPKPGQAIGQLDDVFTTGDAKYEARETLKSLGSFDYPLLAIALDRQEVLTDATGISAIERYEKDTGTKVISAVNAKDVLDYLIEQAESDTENSSVIRRRVERLANYLRVYGTNEAKFGMQTLNQRIMGRERSVIPACDVETLEEFESIVRDTTDVEGVGGYKVGFELGYGYGLQRIVEVARKYTDKPIILDHQKAGTDIPDTGKNFARVCKKAGVDAVILFPQAGPETERAWIYHALDNELKVIVDGRMTHQSYTTSEGGWITDEGALKMYEIAAKIGVDNFVVPRNKPEVIEQIRSVVEPIVGEADYYAPGLIEQGGNISAAGKAAGKRFHGIVGRGIYQAKDKTAAAIEHCSQL